MSEQENQLNNEAVFKIIRGSEALIKEANKFFSKYNVTVAQYNVISILDVAIDRVTQNDLVTQMVVSRSNITGIVDRLEKAGYVAREGDLKDRRVKHVRLLPKGKNLVAEVSDNYFKRLGDVLRFLDAKDKKDIIRIMLKLEKDRG